MNTNKQYCKIDEVPEQLITAANYTLVDIDISLKVIPAFLNLFTNKSYNIIRFDSTAFRLKINDHIQNKEYDFIILESLFTTTYIDFLKQSIAIPIVIRSHNVEFKIWENLYCNEKNILKKWYLNLLSRRLKKYELAALAKPDLIASISNEDILSFRKEATQTPMVCIPFGINFQDEIYTNYAPPESEDLVLFHLGSMAWIPHQEAFRWFLEKVWLHLHKKHPHLQLHLAGTNMPPWITNGQYPNVTVTDGYADSKTFMNKKAIMVVPSFSGSGIRVKIAEGMAQGKIIITTANGAMGIPCIHNENIFISESDKEWVNIISKCITDLELTKRISRNARDFARLEFDHTAAAKKLIQAVVKVKSQ
jgi:glycosyltransferase involved in cell wall biosynthesis